MKPGLHEGSFQAFPNSMLEFWLKVFSRVKLNETLLPLAIATQLGIRSSVLLGLGSSTISGSMKLRLPTCAPATAGRTSAKTTLTSNTNKPVLLNQEFLLRRPDCGKSRSPASSMELNDMNIRE